MTRNREPVFGQTAHVFNDHKGTGSVYVPNSLAADADCLTYKGGALWVAPTEGAKVTSLILCNADTSNACRIDIYKGTAYNAIQFMYSVNVPASSGTNGTTASVNGLSTTLAPGLPRDNAGNPYIDLEAGETLVLIAANADDVKSTCTIWDNTYAA